MDGREFLYQLVSFIMVGFALYGLAHVYTLLSHDPIIKYTRKCKYCRKRINEKVSCALPRIGVELRIDQNRRCDVSIVRVGRTEGRILTEMNCVHSIARNDIDCDLFIFVIE